MTRVYLVVVAVFLVLTGLVSCEPQTDPNTNLIPPGDSLQLLSTDTTTIKAWIEKDDTLRTDNSDRVLLGSMYDPVFGKTQASFYSTFGIAGNHTPIANSVVDSVVLTMRADGGYGDLTKMTGYQVLEVFEVTENIPAAPTKGYNSTYSFNYNPVPLATYGFAPQFFPQGIEPAAIRIKLNPSLGARFFVVGNTINSENIGNYIKGVYVRIRPDVPGMQAPGQGGLVYFKLNSDVSSIKIYWHAGSSNTVTLKLPMASGNRRFTVFSHDYTYADPALQTKLADTSNTTASDKMYIQSNQGLRMKMKLPFLQDYVAGGKVVVNKAEFVFPVDLTQDLIKYPQPSNIMIYYKGSDGLLHFTDDIVYTYYDSFYDVTTKEYKIVITQHIQHILNNIAGIPKEFYFDIPVLSKNTDAFRFVINSPEHSTNPMRLNLSYTRIPTL